MLPGEPTLHWKNVHDEYLYGSTNGKKLKSSLLIEKWLRSLNLTEVSIKLPIAMFYVNKPVFLTISQTYIFQRTYYQLSSVAQNLFTFATFLMRFWSPLAAGNLLNAYYIILDRLGSWPWPRPPIPRIPPIRADRIGQTLMQFVKLVLPAQYSAHSICERHNWKLQCQCHQFQLQLRRPSPLPRDIQLAFWTLPEI